MNDPNTGEAVKIDGERLGYQVNEFAKLAGLSRSYIYELMSLGRLEFVQLGPKKRIIKAASAHRLLGHEHA